MCMYTWKPRVMMPVSNDRLNGARCVSQVEPQLFVLSVSLDW